MNIVFYSLDSYNNKVYFKTEGIFNNNILSFSDDISNYEFIIKNDFITLNRTGSVIMNLIFKKNKKTEGSYKNELGLEMKLEIFTKFLSIKNNKIDIEYDLFINNELISSHKIKILFN